MLFKWPLDCDVCMCGIHTLLLLCLFETRAGSSCLGLPTAIDREAAPHLTYALFLKAGFPYSIPSGKESKNRCHVHLLAEETSPERGRSCHTLSPPAHTKETDAPGLSGGSI